jgi:hypothetical protein
MSAISRRNFLFGAFSRKSGLTINNSSNAKTEDVIGWISDFPLGVKKQLPSFQIFVESLPEGLRIQSCLCPDQFFGVKTNLYGEILVDYTKNWPSDMVFSMMTNEPVRLNNNKEISV